tara:strand:- start:40 stop:393 length:354 start_codon:yes stop_codon:yes gene_type:complete
MMSQYNWCHNPKCHTYHTTDRIRGVKGKKVLRTRKIKVRDHSQAYYWQGWENHFCKMGCLMEFIKKNITSIIAIAPVHQASEQPIDVQVVKHPQETTEYGWTRRAWNETKITPIENN